MNEQPHRLQQRVEPLVIRSSRVGLTEAIGHRVVKLRLRILDAVQSPLPVPKVAAMPLAIKGIVEDGVEAARGRRTGGIAIHALWRNQPGAHVDTARFQMSPDHITTAPGAIPFLVEKTADGYLARATGYAIFTEAAAMDELRGRIEDAVRCHFGEPRPWTMAE